MNPQLRTDPAAIASWVGIIPLRRLGTPEDLAGICISLASDESSWVTGTHVCIDGGFEASFGGPVAPSTLAK
jgi:NAD(P)-dependent dehydrogenase (short-subunit alcohol dehydrogenase family)